MLRFLFLCFLITTGILTAQQPTRVLVPVDGKIGYIDERGELVIPAKYHSGNHFSDDLAPVREHGLYGYIDHTGDYVLPPAYDYAEPFQNGLARVWTDGKQQTIDLEGCNLFTNDYAEVFPFLGHSYATVKSKRGKYGLVDRAGKLLVDTVLKELLNFDARGLAVATHHRNKTYDSDDEPARLLTGVVDTTGRFVVRFGKYKTIKPLGHGVYQASLPGEEEEGKPDPAVIIDHKGEIRSRFDFKKWHPNNKNAASITGVFPVDIYHVDIDKWDWNSQKRYDHAGIITVNGDLVMDQMEWDFISSFENKKAFAIDTRERYWLINDRGEILLEEPFRQVNGVRNWSPNSGFQNGEAIVLRGRKWHRLLNDNTLIPLPDFADEISINRVGDLLLLETERYDKAADDYGYFYGWYDLTTNTHVVPSYKAPVGPVAGTDLLTSYSNEGSYVLNRSGKVVWKGKPSKALTKNIDFLDRAGFLASSPNPDQGVAPGGHYSGGNGQYAVDDPKLKNGGELVVNITLKADQYTIKITNGARDTFFFPAQDSRIELVLQAQTAAGKWQDIQYLPSSWCGNSYHTVDLPPGHGWDFTTNVYTGANATLIRPKLTYKLKPRDRETITVYGNAVPGSINPGQFWRKRTYYPGGLMDPYND